MIFIGDLHGNFNVITRFLDSYPCENTIFIQVGDFGVAVGESIQDTVRDLELLSKTLKKQGNRLFAIRGNHDNPEYFDGRTYFGNITLVKDYSRFGIDGRDILFIGGGISIDRSFRTVGYDYWTTESIASIQGDISDLDIVISHEAPLIAYPDNSALWDDPGNPVKSDSSKGRQILQQVFTQGQPKQWFYGHYHRSHQEIINGTKFSLLNVNEFYDNSSFPLSVIVH
jgi:UDP-2,3-diacylglucosamine pyrophosphatase LpxH